MNNSEASGTSAAVNASVPFRVATWNMDHWKRQTGERTEGWSALRDLHRADIALLQECKPLRETPRQRVAYREIGGSRAWGSAVVALAEGLEVEELGTVRTRYGAKRFPMLGTIPGSIMVARASIAGLGPITFVSVYGVMDVYAQTTMFRIVADLIPLFDSAEGEHVVLGGDFNIDATLPEGSRPEAPRYRAVLEAVKSLGLHDLGEMARVKPTPSERCRCGRDRCGHLQTFGSVQLDYLFATHELASRCSSLALFEPSRCSDHRAIVAEFEPGPLGKHRIDPARFPGEVGLRLGADAGRVVEELLEWAQRKHPVVRDRARATLDRLPTSAKGEPEVWVQLDLPGGRLQWMVSVQASGRVVVHFQHMIGPFASPDRRERLWTDLDSIAEGTLEKRLNGHPSFPLLHLNRPDRLDRFLRILDQIVEETLSAEEQGRS